MHELYLNEQMRRLSDDNSKMLPTPEIMEPDNNCGHLSTVRVWRNDGDEVLMPSVTSTGLSLSLTRF
jgi:hypothetical protein